MFATSLREVVNADDAVAAAEQLVDRWRPRDRRLGERGTARGNLPAFPPRAWRSWRGRLRRGGRPPSRHPWRQPLRRATDPADRAPVAARRSTSRTRSLCRRTLHRLPAFLYAQAVQERNHAMMMVRYLLDADERLAIPGRRRPTDFARIVAPCSLALEQEQRYRIRSAGLARMARCPSRRTTSWASSSRSGSSRSRSRRSPTMSNLAAGRRAALGGFADADRGVSGTREHAARGCGIRPPRQRPAGGAI